ncbi:MAG: hypothetical protein GX663_07095 [Clostridiales bacterium]|nr:hypothetical protein [Clostridiales bacterium]
MKGADANSITIIVSILIYLIWAIIELIAGILGVKNCAKPSKAGTLFTFGVVLLAFAGASAILGMIATGVTLTAIISLIAGLVLPIIFICGAKRNMPV